MRALVLLLCACGSGPTSVPDGGSSQSPPLGAEQKGISTYYDATGAGACSFDATPSDLDVAAMNAEEWENSAVCGACAKVTGPAGTVTVRIVDLCPECKKGHLDLSKEAFAKIADPKLGRIDTTWQLVPCNVSGNVKYKLKDGASQWWTAIQVRNHRIPIRSMDWQKQGETTWTPMVRQSYNYLLEAKGTGPAPIKIRTTAWDGKTIEDTLPDLVAETIYDGTAQF